MPPIATRTRPGWVSPQLVADARRKSPIEFLRAQFSQVRMARGGEALEVKGILRADRRGDRWLSCDWTGQGIGDNVALVQHVLGCSFQNAVFALGSGAVDTDSVQTIDLNVRPDTDRRPRLPHSPGPKAGRAYLLSRSIPTAIVEAAEACGSLRHLRDGIAFIGRDGAGNVRAVSVRHFEPVVLRDGTTVGKRDLVGTDKAFPCILDGDPGRVVVAEGGVTGLAVQALVKATGRPPPTVVVTGGVNVVRWVGADGPAARLLSRASRITVAGEREMDGQGRPDVGKQARTDALRDRLITCLRTASQTPVSVVLPPEGCKDAVDWLKRRMACLRVPVGRSEGSNH